MFKDKKLILIAIAGIFAFLSFFCGAAKEAFDSRFDDFRNYWLNAQIFNQGYNPWGADAAMAGYKKVVLQENKIIWDNPPFHSLGFFIFFLPFGLMGLKASALTWLVFGCAVFLFSAWMLIKTAKRKLEIIDIFSVMFLFFSFWPAREQIHDGQPNFLLLFLISLAFLCFRYDKLFLAGFILGAGVQIRDYLLPIGVFFLLRKDWKPALGFISGYLSLKALAISIFGWQTELSYWNYMFNLFGTQQHSTVANLSIFSLFLRVGKGGVPLLLLMIFGGALGIALLWGMIRLNKTKEGRLAGLCGFTAFCLIVSPWVHESHYVIILPAIILCWFSMSERAKNIDYAMFIAAYILLGFRYSVNNFPVFHSGILGLLSAGKIVGLLILIGLLIRLNLGEENRKNEST